MGDILILPLLGERKRRASVAPPDGSAAITDFIVYRLGREMAAAARRKETSLLCDLSLPCDCEPVSVEISKYVLAITDE